MGVHGLWPLLAPAGRRVSLESMSGKRLAVDTSLWVHHFLLGMKDAEGRLVKNAHIVGIIMRLCKLLFWGVRPVFVFDGATPALKKKTLEERRRKRNRQEEHILRIARRLATNRLKLSSLVSSAATSGQTNVRASSRDDPLWLDPSMFENPHNSDGDDDDAGGALDGPYAASSLEEKSKIGEATEISQQRGRKKVSRYIGDQELEEKIDKYTSSFVDDRFVELQKQWKETIEELARNDDIDKEQFDRLPPQVQFELLLNMQSDMKYESWRHMKSVETKDMPADVFSSLQIQKMIKSHHLTKSINTIHEMIHKETIGGIQINKISSDQNTQYIYIQRPEDSATAAEIYSNESDVSEGVDGIDESQKAAASKFLSRFIPNDNILEGIAKKTSAKRKRPEGAMRQNTSSPHEISDKERDAPVMDSVTRTDEEIARILQNEEYANEAYLQEPAGHVGGFLAVEDSIPQSPSSDVVDAPKYATRELPSKTETKVANEPHVISGPSNERQETEGLLKTQSAVSLPQNRNDDRISLQEILQASNSDSDSTPNSGVEWMGNNQPDEAVDVIEEHKENEQNDKKLDGTITGEFESDYEDLDSMNSQEKTKKEYNESEWEDIVVFDTDAGKPEETLLVDYLQDYEKASTDSKFAKEIISQGLDASNSQHETSVSVEEEKLEPEDTETSLHLAQSDEELEEEAGNVASIQNEFEDVLKQTDPKSVGEMVRKLESEQRELIEEQRKIGAELETIDDEIFQDIKEILGLFGIPFVDSPMEAEAQCAKLEQDGLVDGVITDDSDIWLFGGITVFRNIFDKSKYAEVYTAGDISSCLGLNRMKLIHLALLLGSDYTSGVKGVGVVHGMEVLNAFPGADCLHRFKDFIEGMPKPADVDEKAYFNLHQKLFSRRHSVILPENFPSEVIINGYLKPNVRDVDETFEWKYPDNSSIYEYVESKLGWDQAKIQETIVPALKRFVERDKQATMMDFYGRIRPAGMVVSTRLEDAVQGMKKKAAVRTSKKGAEPSARGKGTQPRKSRALPGKDGQASDESDKNEPRGRARKVRKARNGE